MRLTMDEMIDYIRIKEEEDYTHEDAELVICYGDIEEFSPQFIRYLLRVWLPKESPVKMSIFKSTRGVDKDSIKNRIGEDAYNQRLSVLLPKLAELLAVNYARELPIGIDRLVVTIKYYLKKLMDIMDVEYGDRGAMLNFYKLIAIDTFKDTFEETLDEDLKGGVNTFLGLVEIGTDYYLK